MQQFTLTGQCKMMRRRPTKFPSRHVAVLVVVASRPFQEGTIDERRALLAAHGIGSHRLTQHLVEHGKAMRAIWLDNLRLGLPTPEKWRALELGVQS